VAGAAAARSSHQDTTGYRRCRCFFELFDVEQYRIFEVLFNVTALSYYFVRKRSMTCVYGLCASSRAKCIRCCYCDMFLSPNKFIFHYHRTSDSSTPAAYHHPDAANFNSWRRHLKLVAATSTSSLLDNEARLHAWEDVKAMFNGGSRRRIHHHHQHVGISLCLPNTLQTLRFKH